jgi:hypothetical protein
MTPFEVRHIEVAESGFQNLDAQVIASRRQTGEPQREMTAGGNMGRMPLRCSLAARLRPAREILRSLQVWQVCGRGRSVGWPLGYASPRTRSSHHYQAAPSTDFACAVISGPS